MHLILLHGAAGVWDEVVCLVIPATAIMGVALAILRGNPDQADETEEIADADEDSETAAEEALRAQARSEGR